MSVKTAKLNVKLLSSTPNARRVAFTAIRTCYSPHTPAELFTGQEYERYQQRKAKDNGAGTDTDRLFRMIVHSGHTSTLEHISFTFAIEGLSRSALAQLTRHRAGFSYSVQSQRYVRLGSGDKSGGIKVVVPPKIAADKVNALDSFIDLMDEAQEFYDILRDEDGIPPEDARFLLPNAVATNLVMTANLRALLNFYNKRRPGHGAQWEIAGLAEKLRRVAVEKEPWIDPFFDL